MDFPQTAGTAVIEGPLQRRVRNAQGVAGLFGLGRIFVHSVAWGLAGAVVQISLKSFLPLPIEIIRGNWILLIGIFSVFFFRALWRLRAVFQIPFVAEKLGGQPQDLFLTAWELAEQDGADEFRTRALAQAEKEFPRQWVGRLLPDGGRSFFPWATLALLLFIAIVGETPGPVLNNALWPFQPDLSGRLSVQPGNAFFPRGEDVAVTVRVSTGDFTEPRLEVRSAGSPWEIRPLHSVSPKVYTAILRALQDPLDYRAFCENGRSPRFRLTPFDPPKMHRLQAQIDPPAYTGRKTERVQDVLSLRVLAGSRVRWSLGMDPVDSVLRLDKGRFFPTVEKKGFEWSWTETADERRERRLWAHLPNGSGEVLLAELTIDPIPDAPPQVTLLAPNEDIQADEKDRIPMSVELTDDVGLAEAGIVFRVNQGSWTTTALKHFPRGTTHDILDVVAPFMGHSDQRQNASMLGTMPDKSGNYKLQLRREQKQNKNEIQAGDQIEFYVSARDGRNPPGEGRSETRRIEVFDDKAIHAKVLEDLEVFQKALGERLAEERAVRENVAVSTPNWGGLLTEQRQTARRMEKDEGNFNRLLEQMGVDPGTDRGTLLEHQGLGEDVRHLTHSTLPEADRSLGEQNLSHAARALDQAIAELERMGRLSTEVVRAQNTRQLLRDQSTLSNMAENVARSLAEKPTMSEEDARQFQETVQALQEAMDRIRERVENAQNNLTEEFLKNVRVETMRFDRVSNALARLTQALQQKNGAEAIAAAKEVLAQLREMERQLNRAGESLSFFGSETEVALAEEQDQLKKLILRQETLLDRTLDSPRDALPPWVDEQSALAGDTRVLSAKLAETSHRTALLSPAISQQIATAADVMEGAAHSLRSLAVHSAQNQEEKALELLRDAQEKLSQSLQNRRSLSQNAGAGGALPLRRAGSGILRGDTGDVKLPRADAFRPPAEFRQEIMDSMKETYPQDQEGVVQDYYRHWTK